MKKIQLLLASFVFVAAAAFAFVPVTNVGAENALDTACKNNSSSDLCKSDVKNSSANDLVATIINTLLFIVGILAVIMVIFGGFQYVISQGDSGNVTKAKNTILYSVIGLVVAIFAYAIVNFVLRDTFHLF